MKLRTTKTAVNNARAVKLAFPASHYPMLADLFTPRWYVESKQGLVTTYICPIGNTSYAIVTGIDTSRIEAFRPGQLPTLADLLAKWEAKLNASFDEQAYFKNIAEYQQQFEKDFREWILANYTTTQMN